MILALFFFFFFSLLFCFLIQCLLAYHQRRSPVVNAHSITVPLIRNIHTSPDIDLVCQALQALAIPRTSFLLGAQRRGDLPPWVYSNMHSSCSIPFCQCHQTIWFLKDKEVSFFFSLTFCLVHVAEGQDKVSWRDLQEFGTQKNPTALPEGIRFSWRLSFLTGPVLPTKGKWTPGLIDLKGSL